MQHLVEHHHLHEVAGNARVVERGVDADHLLVVEVDAHLDRAPPAAGAPPSPPDARVHRAGEVAAVQAEVDLLEIVHPAARRQRRLGRLAAAQPAARPAASAPPSPPSKPQP